MTNELKVPRTLGELAAWVDAYDARLDDDSGPNGAQAPTGDDYNEIVEMVRAAAAQPLALGDRSPTP